MLLLRLLLPLLPLHQRLLLPLPLQMVLCFLILFHSSLFSPPLLLLVLLLLLLDGVEPDGPWSPTLDFRRLGPLVRDMSAGGARAVPRLITYSDGVTQPS